MAVTYPHRRRSWPIGLAFLILAGACPVQGFEPPLGAVAPAQSKPAGGGSAYRSPYIADLGKLQELWGGPTANRIEDFFTVVLKVNGQSIKAPTHVFAPLNIVPYSSYDNIHDAAGTLVERGDAEIAKAFPAGAVGFAIKHHRPEHRELVLSGDPKNKEHFKLQDTHIATIVGVTRSGRPGAISVNNPQDYDRGRFGDAGYSMIFVRPTYPTYVTPAQQAAFQNNMRTMLIGFNAVSKMPGDYNGGDPLAANSVEKLRSHVAMMVRAIAGEPAALKFFDQPAHQIYCAELAYLGASAGVIVPLNAKTLVPMVGNGAWQAFAREVKAHNAGETSSFSTLNRNTLVRLVKLSLAPENLAPLSSYAPLKERADHARRLAWQPMTMSDIIEHFLRTHVPREQLGEGIAPIQGAILKEMKDGLLESMQMRDMPSMDKRRMAVDDLFERIVAVVSKPCASYAEFRQQVEPLIREARRLPGPRGGDGAGLFTPPCLFHVVAQDKHPGGLLGLEYVGHGIHFSAVRLARTASSN